MKDEIEEESSDIPRNFDDFVRGAKKPILKPVLISQEESNRRASKSIRASREILHKQKVKIEELLHEDQNSIVEKYENAKTSLEGDALTTDQRFYAEMTKKFMENRLTEIYGKIGIK